MNDGKDGFNDNNHGPSLDDVEMVSFQQEQDITLIVEICYQDETIAKRQREDALETPFQDQFEFLNGVRVELRDQDLIHRVRYIRPHSYACEEGVYKRMKEIPSSHFRFFSLNINRFNPLVRDYEENYYVKIMPHKKYDGIWERLCYPPRIKRTAITFGVTYTNLPELKINDVVRSRDKFLLIEGPAGSGKSCVATGLAQTLSIRINNLYPKVLMVEIKCDVLFGRTGCEGSSDLNAVFDTIFRLTNVETRFVFVYLDRLETIQKIPTGQTEITEDSKKIKETLYAKLDTAKQRKNILFIGTTDKSSSVESSLLARCDCKITLTNPCAEQCYGIIRTVIEEFQCSKLLKDDVNFVHERYINHVSCTDKHSKALFEKCKGFVGMSGADVKNIPYNFIDEVYDANDSTIPFIESLHK
uniref:ATPase_AAA_core domain-containing protein n=1 Tax=Rhabditophanes sp. KR3021 TaxID=114890 RepID=A0AC35TKS1_9BILA